MEEIWGTISGHLKKGLRAEAENRIWEAAPHYIFYWPGPRGGHRGLCTACWQMIEEKEQRGRLSALDREQGREALKKSYEDSGFYGGLTPELRAWGFEEERPAAFRHKSHGTCPLCGALIQYRAEGMSRTYMYDTVMLSHYSRSAQDESLYVMTLWRCGIDWAGWHPEIQPRPDTDLELCEVCLMQAGKPGQRYVLETCWTADFDSEDCRARNFREVRRWAKRKECKGGYDPGGAKPTTFAAGRAAWVRDEWSIEEAFRGTRVAETARLIDHSEYIDGIDLYHAILRYPCTEYLAKLGYQDLAAMIVAKKAGRLMNLRGKTAQAVLRIDGNTWGWLRGNKVPLDARLLEMLHTRDRLQLRLGNDSLLKLISWRGLGQIDADFLRRIAAFFPPGKREKAIRYVIKSGIAVYDYIDHLDILRQLDADPLDDALTMPRDFAAIHAREAGRLKAASDKEKSKRVQKRAEKLGEYQFAALGLVLRPMVSAEEIIREGAVLQHCVGGYVDRYANGKTIILCLREEEAPATPKYTVEFTTAGKLVQVRGYRNGYKGNEWEDGILKKDADRVAEFWRLFEMYRKEYKKAKKKGRCAA